MTPSEEYRLWKFNRVEWAKWIAPKWAKMLAEATPEVKRQLWEWAGVELREALQSLKRRSA